MKKASIRQTSILKLYTKSGDRGEASLGDGRRLPKHHPVFSLLGDLDELNCSVGLVVSFLHTTPKLPRFTTITDQLLQIQYNLLSIGAVVANAPNTTFSKTNTTKLEPDIDWYQRHTGSDWHTRFLLPGGSELAARLDMSRAVCRRTERSLINYSKSSPPSHPSFSHINPYLNRLSDYLFALRCWVNATTNTSEHHYFPRSK